MRNLMLSGVTTRIVMLHDCAYVAYELAKELNRVGHETELMRMANAFTSKLSFLKTARILNNLDCDLIHVHYLRSAAYVGYVSNKPYVVHCHGSDVRNGLSFWQKRALKKAEHVFVATEDLLEKVPDATWLPTPVGPQFHNLGLHRTRKALYLKRDDESLPDELEQNLDVPVACLARKFRYEDMPTLLNSYEFFIDDHYAPLSKVSLEALACGCKVIRQTGEVVEKLPEEHRVENVVKRLIKVYEEVLSK